MISRFGSLEDHRATRRCAAATSRIYVPASALNREAEKTLAQHLSCAVTQKSFTTSYGAIVVILLLNPACTESGQLRALSWGVSSRFRELVAAPLRFDNERKASLTHHAVVALLFHSSLRLYNPNPIERDRFGSHSAIASKNERVCPSCVARNDKRDVANQGIAGSTQPVAGGCCTSRELLGASAS